MPPLVSVLTRTKDRPLLLPRACESVLAQTSPDWEHLIVNDSGDVATLKALLEPLRERYAGRLRVLHRPVSSGMEAASNAGLALATGTYLTIHDDDDAWHPRFLERLTAVLQKEGPESAVQGVVCHTTRVVERLHPDGVEILHRHPFSDGLQPLRLWRLLEENQFPPIAFLFRRAAWEDLGPFNEDLPVLGDWEFNVRFLRRFEIAIWPEYLAFYHHRTPEGAAIYANTVTAQDHLHRSTEAALLARWAASPEPPQRALAAAAQDARAHLLTRRRLTEEAARISALQTEGVTL